MGQKTKILLFREDCVDPGDSQMLIGKAMTSFIYNVGENDKGIWFLNKVLCSAD